jgi:protein-disulfide isomerase
MRMARLAGVLAVLATLLVTAGCASLVTGRAVAGKQAAATAGVMVTDDGFGVVLGTSQDGAGAVIDLFIEPQCPHCGHFVAEYGDAIAKYLAADRLAITIRPLTFLDNGSDDYSARATNAIFLVAADKEATPARVWSFIQALYAKLLSNGSLANDDGIAQIANDVGVSANTVNRIAAAEPEVNGDDVSEGNLALMDDYGVQPATPAVYDTANKVEVNSSDPQWLDKLVK